MQLEKIVTDWYTFYAKTSFLNEIKNCIIYISERNINRLKKEINNTVNSKDISFLQKELDLEAFKNFINFIRVNNSLISQDCIQTDELLFVKANNSYIVVVKETKDVTTFSEGLELDDYENDTIYIALSEDSQILTVKDSLCEIIQEYEFPVFCLNIREK